MTKQRIAKTAPKSLDRKAVLTVNASEGKRAILAIAKAANTHSGAEASVLEALAANVKPFGPMTGEQWDAYVKPGLLEQLAKQPKVKDPDNYASKFKTAGLALASGLPDFKEGFGETLKAYLDRVREPLRSAVLKDGRTIVPAGKVSGPKPMTAKAKAEAKAKRETEKAAKALTASTADDAGHDVSRYHALAVSLMGSEAGGTLLLAILKDHREAFDVWAKDRVAKAVDTSKAPKAPKVPEPSADDKAINRTILAMANATEPKAKANGAAK